MSINFRLWWAIGFIMVVVICIYLISIQSIKWRRSPVIVSFSKKFSPIWEIPFPAVTICPLRKIELYNSPVNYDYYYKLFVLNPEEFFQVVMLEELLDTFLDLALICVTEERRINITKEFASSEINSNLAQVGFLKSSMIPAIKWKNEFQYDPEKTLFFERITSEGLCFTFNALAHEDLYTREVATSVRVDHLEMKSTGWSIERGYSNDENYHYPDRSYAAGVIHGLQTELFLRRDFTSKYCGTKEAGYKIQFHNPAELPRMNERYFLAGTLKRLTISVKPKVMRTSDHLLGEDPHTRGCYFQHEKKLKYFQVYTYSNCKSECEVILTETHCGCVPFYLPNLHMKYEYYSRYQYTVKEAERSEYETFLKCDCLPSCYSLNYDIAISQADFLVNLSKYNTNHFTSYWGSELTILNIFFSNSEFLAMERKPAYETIDILANIGGFLGLFMGFSVLSAVELFFYLLLVLSRKLKKYKIFKRH